MWHSNSRRWLVTHKRFNIKRTQQTDDAGNSSTLLENNKSQAINRQTNRHKSHYTYESDDDFDDETWPPTMQLQQLQQQQQQQPEKQEQQVEDNKKQYGRNEKALSDLSGIAQRLPTITNISSKWPKSHNKVILTATTRRAKTVNQLYQLHNQIIVVLLLAILLAANSSSLSPMRQTYAYELHSIDDDYEVSRMWQRQQRLSNINNLQQQQQQNFKISPKPCSIGDIDGTCMFVWECIKSEGRHVGMCVDAFMFGSCCVHNYTDNIVMPPSFAYTRPTKPLYIGHQQHHKPRPPPFASPHRPPAVPGISGMTTIERPHGAGTLVIRPSGPHHQRPSGALHRPHTYTSTTRRTTTTKTTPPANINDMQTAASFSKCLQ